MHTYILLTRCDSCMQAVFLRSVKSCHGGLVSDDCLCAFKRHEECYFGELYLMQWTTVL